jgi:hypothetical protein
MSDHDHLRPHPYTVYVEVMQAYVDTCRYDREHQTIQRRTQDGLETIYPPETQADHPEEGRPAPSLS